MTVNKSVEGNSYFRCASFAAKKVHGDSVQIVADHEVKVAALYGDATVISAGADIEVGNLSGSLEVLLLPLQSAMRR